MKKISIRNLRKTAITIASLAFASVLVSCKSSEGKSLIIWTSNPEIASYAELFNSTHGDSKAVVVYKDEPTGALPPAKDELPPDIIIAPWLKNTETKKHFLQLNYLFQDNSISNSSFYQQLLEYGKINDKQYLIPVSFNLPAMIFSRKNEFLVDSDHTLNIDQIKSTAEKFNKKNQSSAYTAMGFAPSWDTDFIYLATKLNGTSYVEKGTNFSWDETCLQSTITQIKEWTSTRNTDTSSEQNFQFRYLYMPEYRQVTTDRCLFAYVTSDELFKLTDAQTAPLSFRWIEQDNKIPVEDNIVSIGIYKNANLTAQAEKFLIWFFQESTQKQLINRMENMKLDTVRFGIAGGFSSIKGVTEKFYPAFYRQLLGNLPPEEYLTVPSILPYRWASLKSKVIVPYLSESIKTDSDKPIEPLESRITEWTKQNF